MIIQSISQFSKNSGGFTISGVNMPYFASSSISKGDFVQLTSKGVEEPAFTEIGSFSNTANGKNGVGICVLSQSLIMYTYAEYAAWGTAGECSVYAQASYCSNGLWQVGPKLLVYSKSGAYCDVDITRLDDSTAALCFGCKVGTSSSSASSCSFFVLTADENGEISIAASSVDSLSIGNLLYTPIHAIGITDSSFAVLTPSSNYGGLGVAACTYSNGTIAHTAAINQIFAGSSSYDYGLVYGCKLNDNAIIISHNSGSNSTSSSKSPVIVHITGTSAATEIASITVYCGPMCYVSDNTVALLPFAKSKALQLLSYDTAAGTLSKKDILTAGAYYHYEIVQLGDDKFCALASTGTNPQSANFGLAIIDSKELTYTYLNTIISGASSASYYSPHIAVSHSGWMALIGDRTCALAAPIISKTTASPYSERIDGIALTDAAANEAIIVAVPE